MGYSSVLLGQLILFYGPLARSIACEVWSLRFQDKLYNSDSLLIVLVPLFRDTVLIIHL